MERTSQTATSLVSFPIGRMVIATEVKSRALIFKPPKGLKPKPIRRAFDRHIVRTPKGVVVMDVCVKAQIFPLQVKFVDLVATAREEVDIALKEEGKEKTAGYEDGVRMIAERMARRLRKKGVKVELEQATS